jgi:hypothetical protein
MLTLSNTQLVEDTVPGHQSAESTESPEMTDQNTTDPAD